MPVKIPVTGGLAGDGMQFASTYTVFDGVAREASIAAIGFYRENLRFGYGSSGGWIPFGPERLITASKGNTLYELDGQPPLLRYPGKLDGTVPERCVLVSCVGRKAVLKQLTEEETEIVAESYGNQPVMTGFYSYGEIALFLPGHQAIQHNQTMTITTLSEE